jgi:hypothetical protein
MQMASLHQTVQSLITAKKDLFKLEGQLLRELGRMAARGVPRAGSSGASGRRLLACPRCPRKFALPLHLGRHISATHKRKKRPAKKS